MRKGNQFFMITVLVGITLGLILMFFYPDLFNQIIGE